MCLILSLCVCMHVCVCMYGCVGFFFRCADLGVWVVCFCMMPSLVGCYQDADDDTEVARDAERSDAV